MADHAHAGVLGLLAGFSDAATLLESVRRLREAGLRRMEAFTPYPVPGLDRALASRRPHVASWMFIGGLIGAAGALALQFYASMVDYPLNIGGRPLNSWPLFIPIAAEMLFLGAALAGVIASLHTMQPLRFYHPVFEAPEFANASSQTFFILVPVCDPAFEVNKLRQLLEALEPESLRELRRNE